MIGLTDQPVLTNVLSVRSCEESSEGQCHSSVMKRPKGSSSASWCVYCLLSADYGRTYVGVTSDVHRRIRQHNGELTGGAKAARAGRPWKVVCTIRGFTTFSQACRFEWSWKNISKRTSHKREQKGTIETSTIIEASPVIGKRQAALERVKSLRVWPSLDIKWYLTHGTLEVS